jgi:hypothetical protein
MFEKMRTTQGKRKKNRSYADLKELKGAGSGIGTGVPSKGELI